MLKIIFLIGATVGIAAAQFGFKKARPLSIQYPQYFGNNITIPQDNPTTEEGVFLGRMLFYETALSANGKISCATCHQQKLAFTDGRQFSAGFSGMLQSRNTMSLANLLWVRRFFWDGRITGLENQAAIPMASPHEMGQSPDISAKKLQTKKIYASRFRDAFGSAGITGDRIIMALSQFERTLVSAGSQYDKYLQGKYTPTPAQRNGIKLFFGSPDPSDKVRGADCGHCHGGPKTFSELFQNNGLDSFARDPGREKVTGQDYDRGRFRVATLRNIALTAPYMHDGRFYTLEEVVSHYNEHIVKSNTLSIFLKDKSNDANGKSLNLTVQEKNDLVAFLHMLTDSTFIRDKRFSNPFLN